MSNVLILRISALGDVAMTIPVVYSVAEANPHDTFTVLTQTSYLPLFIHLPQNVRMLSVNTQTTQKCFFRFLKFALQLRTYHFDQLIDLHNVIRSWIVHIVFRLQGKPVYVMNKNRREGRRLTARPPKVILPLQPVIDRYAAVFAAAGFGFEVRFISLYHRHPADSMSMNRTFGEKRGRWIGIAPFARHKGKGYPLKKMEKIVEILSGYKDITLFLFGGGRAERDVLHRWESAYCNTVNCSGRWSMEQELALMRRLELMISMDSANMHLASLVGVKVLSIWGATHPFGGFYGYRQSADHAVQTMLPCRPCAIYGEKRCYRGDWACINNIAPEQIIKKINDFLDGL